LGKGGRAPNRKIGILGGMGPESTVYLFSLIVKNTRAKRDQDQLGIIIDNNPQIPDRTEAILGRGLSPLPELERSIRNLEKCGVDLIVIPCNTIFYFYESIQSMTDIPVIHTIKECVDHVKKNAQDVQKVGLLATTGTIMSKLYQKYFSEIGIEVIIPGAQAQNDIMDIIYGRQGIKASYIQINKAGLLKIARQMLASGAKAVVAGCTEIELTIGDAKDINVINPLQILASVVTEKAMI
jgi:aspartate racemase